MKSTGTALFLALALSAAQAGDLSLTEIQAAKKLYNGKCAKCHKFYDPGNYTQAEWETWMQKMGKKSKLKPQQYQLLSRYLETFRAENKDQVLKR
jgi:Dihaem cytochrome c